jgi:Zn-dependent M16 (insulinase) family peptidase
MYLRCSSSMVAAEPTGRKTHSILDGSTLLRFNVSFNTAASKSSGVQSLKPPFLA